uniref:Response regulatory domain-containing protein n=1 Tax=Magnetococcus massalia (strain MO-1) TaxID=451514 RepID=A0A1S7LKB3_MAGMO|nr:conserved protein of unknown function [Candidatus Magnetococcus massalia]
MICLKSKDLLTRTQLESSWKMQGLTTSRQPDGETTRLIVIDLRDGDALEQISQSLEGFPQAQVVAFGPHVDGERLKAAKTAGAHTVLARSAVKDKVQEMAAKLS